MPIYEYLCESCGRMTELMQKMTDPPPRTCPECGSKKIAKLVSRTAFQLKGGGWYADLYSSPNKQVKDAKGSAAPSTSGAAEKAAAGSSESTAAKSPATAEKKAGAPKGAAGDSKS